VETAATDRGGAAHGPARGRRTEEEVVVHWRQRAVSPSGERFDGEALGLYEVRDGKLARAQMFYFDAIAVERFLAEAEASDPSAAAAVTN
jgi:ketosteroid isomerase-like protein